LEAVIDQRRRLFDWPVTIGEEVMTNERFLKEPVMAETP
jgi:hypothetical protein